MAAEAVGAGSDARDSDADHLSPDPDHLSPDPDHLSHDPDHLSPDADHLSPDADHLSPDPDHLSPDADHLSPDPDHLGPDARIIVAMGGGGFSQEPDNTLLDEFVLSHARQRRPRVCFVPTASGDSVPYLANFYRSFARFECFPAELTLFERTVRDLEAFVLEQDVLYIGGGSTANMLAVWRVHGLDRVLRTAWEAGVVLAGLSAGMNCWFEASVTDSFGLGRLAPLQDGLGLLAGTACPHYDGEPERRPTYRRLVGAGELGSGWAADDGAALVFRGSELHEVVSSRPAAAAYRVERDGEESITEERLTARYLGA